MRDTFFSQKKCSRCGCPLDGKPRQMSRFNTDCLCPECIEVERQHPDYRKAADAEMEAVRRGERNFPGIGWPGSGRSK